MGGSKIINIYNSYDLNYKKNYRPQKITQCIKTFIHCVISYSFKFSKTYRHIGLSLLLCLANTHYSY